MQTHDIAPHLEQITRALGDKVGTEVSQEDLAAELQKYLEYGVPPDQAVRTILRHHGEEAPPTTGAAPVVLQGRTQLADVPGNAQSVDVLARILSINTRTVTARGEEKDILWGLLGDETATVPYTSWRPLEGLEKGDVIEVQAAYSKEWRGETQLNFGDRTIVTKKDPSELPEEPAEIKDLAVEELRPGLRGFRLTGRILTVAQKEVQTQNGPKVLWEGAFADASGRIAYTCWDEVGLEEGAAITLAGASVRQFRGVPQLNFDATATIEPFDGDLPSREELDVVHPLPIADLVARGDVGDAVLRATVLEVRPGSGLVWRDPETNRVLAGGQSEGATPDLRVKMVLDDGTGAVSAVVGRPFVEATLGKDLDECLAEAKEAMRSEVIEEQLAERLTGRVFLAEGFSRRDEYGVMFIARDMRPGTEDAEAAAQAIMDRLEDA